jgi:allophanate hydrolase subunit 1
MNSPTSFIVKPLKGKRYDNTKTYGNIDFIISTSQEDHRFSNRQAEVIELPIVYNGPIKPGDKLLVHHNVFKYLQ